MEKLIEKGIVVLGALFVYAVCSLVWYVSNKNG